MLASPCTQQYSVIDRPLAIVVAKHTCKNCNSIHNECVHFLWCSVLRKGCCGAEHTECSTESTRHDVDFKVPNTRIEVSFLEKKKYLTPPFPNGFSHLKLKWIFWAHWIYTNADVLMECFYQSNALLIFRLKNGCEINSLARTK